MNYLAEIRWGGKISCIHCKHEKVYHLKGKFKRYKCAKCLKQFSATKGTIFESSQVPLKKWFAAIYLHTAHKKGISSCQLARDITVTQKTAWFMLHRIRYMLRERKIKKKINELVMADETFVGGKNKNRPYKKKVKHSGGRSFVDKTPVLGLLIPPKKETIIRPHKVIPDREVKEKKVIEPLRIECYKLPDTKGKTIRPILYQRIEKGAMLITDEWGAYNNLGKIYDHHVVDHANGQYVNDQGFTTNHLEGAWSHLKRSIIGIYHNVSRKHLHRYADEFCYRLNTLTLKDPERFRACLSTMEGRLRYKELIAA